MSPTNAAKAASFALLVCACGEDARPAPAETDCSATEGVELLNVSDFDGADSGWFQFADPTPGAVPNPAEEGSNVPVTELPAPGRCGDTRVMKLESRGHNFWGAGFGDWAHNPAASRANGMGYAGISFWARAARDSEKQFFLQVDDGRTLVFPPEAPEGGGLPLATEADQDLDGDGFVGPGDIARGTRCRLPPPEGAGDATCYGGGVGGPPTAGVRVPSPDECGNPFHTRVTVTESWQPYFIPWNELVQWPCPNRLKDGIDPADIAKFQIDLVQGAHYELYIDDIAFYR